ncbi:MAG: hypothetical protein AABZ77_03450, partial [Chloroflexota bacterium]
MKRSVVKVLGSWLTFLVLVMMIVVPAPVRVLAAGVANLVLLPASQTVGVNSTFNVDVQVQTNGQQIDVVQAYLDFAPIKLAVNSITPTTT